MQCVHLLVICRPPAFWTEVEEGRRTEGMSGIGEEVGLEAMKERAEREEEEETETIRGQKSSLPHTHYIILSITAPWEKAL